MAADQSAPLLWSGDYGFAGGNDRRLAFSRRRLLPEDRFVPAEPQPDGFHAINIQFEEGNEVGRGFEKPALGGEGKVGVVKMALAVIRAIGFARLRMRQLALMILLNMACSTTELSIGLFTGRIGLVSHAFHLTLGCGLLTFSLFAMAASSKKPDGAYTYGYKRLEVLAAFTNALFLVFMSFSLAVEALHAFIQDESEHEQYLIVSAVANLLVNLHGLWFFRSYARVNITYRTAEDMHCHSICLHVLADSIRSAGLILASWFLSIGIENAEVLCMGLVSAAVLMLILPLFRATGSIFLQTSPPTVPSSALNNCCRQITVHEDVAEVSQARFWELVPGHATGSLSMRVKKKAHHYSILQYVRGLFHDLGVQDLTVQVDYV